VRSLMSMKCSWRRSISSLSMWKLIDLYVFTSLKSHLNLINLFHSLDILDISYIWFIYLRYFHLSEIRFILARPKFSCAL
jgi:hypothetical protein